MVVVSGAPFRVRATVPLAVVRAVAPPSTVTVIVTLGPTGATPVLLDVTVVVVATPALTVTVAAPDVDATFTASPLYTAVKEYGLPEASRPDTTKVATPLTAKALWTVKPPSLRLTRPLAVVVFTVAVRVTFEPSLMVE